VIAICYGEWPGVRASAPNGQLAYHQYGLGPFETSGVIVYALVLLAFASLLLGAARLARWSAGLGVLAAAATHVVSVRGGTAAANLTFLVVLALCLVPQAMASVGYRRARVRPSAGPVLVCLGLTLLGPVLFSTSRWSGGWADDRREAFYRSGSGFVLLATPAIPVVAGLVLVAAGAVALRRQRLEIWTAASLVLVPAAAWTFGGGRIASHTPDAYVYQGSFGAFLTICTMTAVVAVLHLALGRPVRSSDPELGRP
jgi:hypothetical protein